MNDSISTSPYIVQVNFLKDVEYSVQHFIVSNDKNHCFAFFEFDFILKKSVKTKSTEEDILVMLAQKNFEEITNTSSTDAAALVDLQSTTTQSKTSRYE